MAIRCAGAAAWCVAGFKPLFASGAGSAVSAYELAELALSERFGVLIDRWIGVLVFALPLCGAALLMSLLAEGALARALRWALVVVAGVVSTVIALDIANGQVGRFGTAIWIGLGGTMAALCAASIEQLLVFRGRTERA